MIEAHLRSKLQPLFDTLGKRLFIPWNISPNTITALAFASGILSAALICFNQLMLALIFLLFSGLCDILDGTVARITNNAQKTGAYIDLIADRMVEAGVILGFTVLYPQYYFAYILFLIAVLLHFSTFVVAGALLPNTSNKSMHHDHSVVERAEAFAVFAAMLLFPHYIFPLLTGFSCIIIADGTTRFFRVLGTGDA